MGLVFMLQIAQMKSLNLLDEDPFGPPPPPPPTKLRKSRRSSQLDEESLKEQLLEVVSRLFDKYRNP